MSAISQKYQANPWLGKPTTTELICPDGQGHYQHFEKGSIYWTASTGANLIYGLIRNKWASMGWERSPLGYPMSDESDAGSKKGRYNNFQNGSIIWKSGTPEAFAVYGAIYGKWADKSYDSGFLGFPLTDETGTPDGIGRYNHFEGGSIYWTPDTGAHSVQGAIRDAWTSQGWEVSRLQYPITDELVTDGTNGLGRHSNFEGGEIYWTPTSGTKINLYPVKSIVRNASRDLSSGHVTASEIRVELFNDGQWKFHAHLYDDSTYYGDGFGMGFVFDGDGHGAAFSGGLGAKYSGPARNFDGDIGGHDPWIEKFWHKASRAGLHFELKVEEDPLSALGTVKHALSEYGPSLVALAGSL